MTLLDDPTAIVSVGAVSARDGQNSRITGEYFANRGHLFAPARHGNTAEAYTDGRTAMRAMAQAIRGAQKFIFIADWQMNFDVELDNRGDPDHPDRLSELLYHAMVRGVDVRVLLYDSIEAAAYTHENENLQTLYRIQERLPEDALGSIQVALQNPATGRSDPFNILFSHHQKILLVDGETAFIGGLDFAHGRWDDGNFDVVCDPRLHVLNDHYNNGLKRGRAPTEEEWQLTRPGLGRGLNNRPGFAPPYLAGLTVAVDRMRAMWEAGETLAELTSYADKAAVDGPLKRETIRFLADIPLDGFSEIASMLETVGGAFHAIQEWATEADHKYRDVISAQIRAIDEAQSGNMVDASRYQLEAFRRLVPNPITMFQENLQDLKAKVEAASRLVREHGPAALDKAREYYDDPAAALADVQALLDRVQSAYDALVKWINTPMELDRSQLLLDPHWHPRMPWQDVHMKLQGPAVFDVFRNYVYRWNATVCRNKAMRPYQNAILGSFNAGIAAGETAGLLDDGVVPRQTTMIRGAELSLLDQRWLDAMGGREALFGDVRRHGTKGKMAIQVLRSSGTALHTQEQEGIAKSGLDLRDNPQGGARRLDRGGPMSNVLNAMVNCIGSAKAYVYIESQFLISDCGWSDADGEPLSESIIKQGRGGEMTTREGIAARAAGAAAPVGDAVLPGTPLARITRPRVGEKSPARNPIVDALADRIAAAIAADQRFHVYLVLPVHPEGSLLDAPVVKQQYWIQQSIYRGHNSLVRRICRRLVMKQKGLRYESGVQEEEIAAMMGGENPPWKAYLTVLNLRSYGILQDAQQRQFVVTEQCYVHSKLMIVDDAVAIIGSANVNDRSLMGDGDTEIAAVVVDGEHELRDLGNGQRVVTRAFARELRKKLWRKFLGMEIEDYDPVLKPGGYSRQTSEQPELHPPFSRATVLPNGLKMDQPVHIATIESIQGLAKNNAAIYHEVFRHVPRDSMRRYRDALDGFPCVGYKLGADGKPERNLAGQRTQAIRLHGEPPALQPGYMRRPVGFNPETGVTEEPGEHDVDKAFARLRALQGFWVEMPLMWGHAMNDPAPLLPGQAVAQNDLDVLPELPDAGRETRLASVDRDRWDGTEV